MPCSKGRVACRHAADPLSQESTCLLHTPVAGEWFRSANQQSEEEQEQVGLLNWTKASHSPVGGDKDAARGQDIWQLNTNCALFFLLFTD